MSIDAGDAARARRTPDVGADVVQVPYSRLQRDAESDVLPACAELGVGVLAREPLANRYLSGKYGRDRRITDPGDWRSSQDAAEVDQKLALLEEIQQTELPGGVPLPQWAWSLRHPAVSAVIPGSRTISQLESNAAAADLELVLGGTPERRCSMSSGRSSIRVSRRRPQRRSGWRRRDATSSS